MGAVKRRDGDVGSFGPSLSTDRSRPDRGRLFRAPDREAKVGDLKRGEGRAR